MSSTKLSSLSIFLYLISIIWSLIWPCQVAMAEDIDDNDFSLRLPAALSRFASYGDVAAVGGASAGSKWGSAINPASIDWLASELDYTLNLNPQYSFICFQKGTKLQVAPLSATVNLEEWGSVQTTVAVAHSNVARTKTGLDFEFEMEHYQLQWAKRLENCGVGVNFNYAPSSTRFDLGPWRVSKSRSDSYGFRAGGLLQVTDKLLTGLVLDYGAATSRTVMYDFLGLGIGDSKIKDTTHQYSVRPGISYEYKEDSAVYADYQYFQIHNDTGNLGIHRLLFGIDHELFDGFFVRSGVAFDDDGNAAVTGGVGIYPNDWLTIDVGYQYNMFPELKSDFGRSQILVTSVGITF